MVFSQTAVAAVGDEPDVRLEVQVVAAKEGEVIGGARGVGGAYDALAFGLKQHLTFQGVVFSLAAVVTPLFF